MYGLLLENMSDYIITNYGPEKWEEIRRLANVDQPSFSVHQVYPENLIPRLSKKAIQVLGVSEKEFFEGMGVHFVGFVSQYGYDRVLSVLGRHMRDFLNGLDNLHEYLKFSYPRMRAPSFICENETRQGLTLHYRSKRRGFVYYTMGQIREVAHHFYHKEMQIELVREELLLDTVHVTFQLTFDNRAFGLASLTMTREEKHLPISASVLFEIFPFCIVFSSDMVVRSVGNSLMVILSDLVGNKITNWFDLVRPLIAFQFQKILNRTNNIFELVTVEPVLTGRPCDRKRPVILSDESDDSSTEKNLRLKGQMIYMDEWRMMIYLGTPVMPDLSSLVSTGLYINDLPMHDFSRDLMLAGTQQSVELKLALDQEQHKSKKLEESMRRLDMEMRRTDELLYQMIPKAVADRLRAGENPIDTCKIFDSVSILFADVVTFTEICSRLSPMEVVSMLNGMYSIFDTLTESNKVYKVETIGDAYMVVSGAPEKEDNHAEKVCDMALDMLEAITGLQDPSTGSHLQIRVGVHSGAVVAGIVGLKMPRYCLFGDTVNTASRMESTSEAMRVHVSQTTRELLPAIYRLSERGEINVKGKGTMKTYWLEGREARSSVPPISPLTDPDGNADTENGDDVPSLSEDQTPPGDDHRVYSPVTFEEIAKHSGVSSPIKTAQRRGSNQLSSANVRAVSDPPMKSSPTPTPTLMLPHLFIMRGQEDRALVSGLETLAVSTSALPAPDPAPAPAPSPIFTCDADADFTTAAPGTALTASKSEFGAPATRVSQETQALMEVPDWTDQNRPSTEVAKRGSLPLVPIRLSSMQPPLMSKMCVQAYNSDSCSAAGSDLLRRPCTLRLSTSGPAHPQEWGESPSTESPVTPPTPLTPLTPAPSMPSTVRRAPLVRSRTPQQIRSVAISHSEGSMNSRHFRGQRYQHVQHHHHHHHYHHHDSSHQSRPSSPRVIRKRSTSCIIL